MKNIALLVLLISIYTKSDAQLYMTKTGYIGFFSRTSLEDIKADNNQVFAVIDAAKKNIALTLLMKGFLFARELQQEHFNENYVESDKYPKANFSGNYSGDIDISKNGVYPILVTGELTMHNITNVIQTPATIEVKNGKLMGSAQFTIKPEDYKISIPSIVRDKISKEIKVTVKIECTPK